MLTNEQIISVLVEHGFVFQPSKSLSESLLLQTELINLLTGKIAIDSCNDSVKTVHKKAKCFKFEKESLTIYIKKSKKYPLVVNTSTNLSEISNISGIRRSQDDGIYFNSNLIGFEKRLNEGENEISCGFDFSFENLSSLMTFINILLGDKNILDLSYQELNIDLADNTKNITEKIALMKLRIGQSQYRENLLKYWKGCAVTGCRISEFLIASHIKPWSLDKDSRLDPFNGLLLLPNLDKAFDRGLISFDDEGLIMISSSINKEAQKLLNIHAEMKLRYLDTRHKIYLKWHRENLYKI